MSEITELIQPSDLLFGIMNQLHNYLNIKKDIDCFIADLINKTLFHPVLIDKLLTDINKNNIFICIINPDCIKKYKSNVILGYIQIKKYTRTNN